MRLYLSSFRMGDDFQRLVEALPAGAAVAVVSNAADFIAPEDRAAYARNVFDPVERFRAHGLAADELDLRDYFGRPEALGSALAKVRLVWANGGNAFLLRRAMRQSGLDELLRKWVPEGRMIYGGWSAGAVVAGTTLRGLHLMDDAHQTVEGYDPAPIWDGVGLIDLALVPHFQSAHPEAVAAANATNWLTKQGIAFQALRDGEVLIL